MHLTNLFKISIQAVLVNKSRTILTSLGIIIGVASVILLVSIGTGIQNYVTNSFKDLGADLLLVMPGKVKFGGSGGGREGGAPGAATNKITLKISNNLQRHLLSDAIVSPIITTPVTIKHQSNLSDSSALGVGAEYPTVRNSPLSSGRFFNESELNRTAKVVVVGTTVAKNSFTVEDPLGQEITINDQRYKIIGVLESKGSSLGNDQDNIVILPISTLQQLLNIDKVSYIYVKVNISENINAVTTKINNYLTDRQNLKTDEFSVTSSAELLKTITGILGVITIALSGIAAISLVVGGIGIMNIMLVSVTERTREIGLRKAVGAKPSDILLQFLIEAVFLSVIGGVIGIIIGALGSLLISRFVETSVTFWSVALAFGFSTLVGVVFGVWPARKASKLSPIEALRYE